jgi:hypothetical protein
MSFKVTFPDGDSVFISKLNHDTFTTHQQLEDKARDMAIRLGGQAYYESVLPRILRNGVYLNPRWIAIGDDFRKHVKG